MMTFTLVTFFSGSLFQNSHAAMTGPAIPFEPRKATSSLRGRELFNGSLASCHNVNCRTRERWSDAKKQCCAAKNNIKTSACTVQVSNHCADAQYGNRNKTYTFERDERKKRGDIKRDFFLTFSRIWVKGDAGCQVQVSNGSVTKTFTPSDGQVSFCNHPNTPLNDRVTSVFTGPRTDLLYGKTAQVSSVYGDNSKQWGPQFLTAPKSITKGPYGSTKYWHSKKQVKPWARVDLGCRKSIQYVVVKNRCDCCSDRLNGMRVYVDGIPCGEPIRDLPLCAERTVTCDVIGQSVKIVGEFSPKKNYMNIQSLKAFGETKCLGSPGKFLVVLANSVVGSFDGIKDAKAKLNDVAAAESKTSRMICEVDKNGRVKEDPHKITDADGNLQGAGAKQGFNKWWRNWNDIRAMTQVCQDSLGSRGYTLKAGFVSDCPSHNGCLNQNIGYDTLKEAQSRCDADSDCGLVMQYSDSSSAQYSVPKFYLRRTTDPQRANIDTNIVSNLYLKATTPAPTTTPTPTTTLAPATTPATPPAPITAECKDGCEGGIDWLNCKAWATAGHCERNREIMQRCCAKSCGLC